MAEEDPKIAEIGATLLAKVSEFEPEQAGWHVRPLYTTMSRDNFASVLYLAETVDKRTRAKVSLIVKVLPEDPFFRMMQNSDKQFANEINLLQNIVPLLRTYSGLGENVPAKYDMVPKCYYADSNPDDPVIVMENLKTEGFTLPEGLLLDFAHCKMAVESLARYHAMGYTMKHRQGEMFTQKIVDTLLEARYTEISRNANNVFMCYTSMDPINFILNSKDPKLVQFRKENEEFLAKLEKSFANVTDLLVKLSEPKEPLAVLCHGDFNRNNMMFTYAEDRRTPTSVKLLDFQTIRYANPGTDLVFFFLMNTTSTLRRQHLDALLDAYQTALVESLTEMGVASRNELELTYSLALLKEDFEEHVLIGYVVSAMFVHFMLASDEEIEEVNALREKEADLSNPSLGYLRKSVSLGGEEAMRRSVAIIEEMAVMKHIIF